MGNRILSVVVVAIGLFLVACSSGSDQVEQTGHYQIKQSAKSVNPKEHKSVLILSASPVYYLNINGQLKNQIDRTFYCFMQLKDKEFYYITACADREPYAADCAIEGFRGFVRCLPNPIERGMIKATGMGRKGGVKGSSFMQEAYNLGKTI